MDHDRNNCRRSVAIQSSGSVDFKTHRIAIFSERRRFERCTNRELRTVVTLRINNLPVAGNSRSRLERRMTADLSSQFVEHLRQSKHLTKANERDAAAEQETSVRRQGKLWELTDLSAGEFADEAARFHGLERVTLQDIMSALPLVTSFSQRFLREMTVFPYLSADGGAVLAVADPTDLAAQRAAQIVLGADVVIKVAAFDDLAVALSQRLGEDDVEAIGGETMQPRDDDIESLRDLASGAPVVRAVNDLLEKAVELRASDIHIEPFHTG